MEKKKINWFKIVFVILFVIYISLYIINANGYYDGATRRRTELTESQIKEFEKDIQDGKEIDVKKYLKDQNKDYTNAASKLGYTFSKNVDNFLNKGIKNVLSFLIKFLS